MHKVLAVIVLAMLYAPVTQAQPMESKSIRPRPETSKPLPAARTNAPKPCAEYGAGFVRIEGTASCVRIGGTLDMSVGTSTNRR